MKVATATLHSISPYSQSRMVDVPRNDKETADEHEKRTWRQRVHAHDDGRIFIPPMCFKRALETASGFLSMQIKGRGKATYRKHFKAGVLVTDALTLAIKRDEVPGETFFMNADGVRGSGKRVPRTFPVIKEWRGDVAFYILDDTITKDVFERHLTEAGNFIGIGRFRPEVGGFYGRFGVDRVEWTEQ